MPARRTTHARWRESLIGQYDVQSIRECLMNLVANAHRYGTPGGEIAVELEDAPGSPALRVRNHGEPIPAATLAVMFDPLRRGGIATGASLGLGLFIVQQIARAHGGSVCAECRDGITEFTVTLPRR